MEYSILHILSNRASQLVVGGLIKFIMSKTNNFRLQRLTKTIGTRESSSLSNYEPKETLKLAALNSINLGIKHNDLSYLSGQDLKKLRKEPEMPEDMEYDSAHINLTKVRRNYDTIHKDKSARDSSISKLKEEKTKLLIAEGELVDNKTVGKEKVLSLEQALQMSKRLYLETETQKKVLLNMRNRLKKDKVVYDQRKFNMDKELGFLRKQKQVIILDKNGISEADDRTNKIYKKYVQQLQAETAQRQEHLASLEKMIEERQRVNQVNGLRGVQIKQIAQRAMQDKDEEQVKWEKLYLANRFVNRLLRDKMDGEMLKFMAVETAFKNIKICTGVSDANTFVDKFLNKESAYGDLLGKIAQNQKALEQLKVESQVLKNQFKVLEAEKEVIDSTKKVEENIDVEMKALREIEERKKLVDFQKERLRQWIIKSVRKMNSVLGKNLPLFQQRQGESIAQSFILYLKNIAEEATQIEKEGQLKNESFTIQKGITNKKIVRVRQDSKPEEESDNEAIEEENNLVQYQRQEMIAGNEKFMREARQKYEQKKKAAAEAASPKKKPVDAPIIKKVEEEY